MKTRKVERSKSEEILLQFLFLRSLGAFCFSFVFLGRSEPCALKAPRWCDDRRSGGYYDVMPAGMAILDRVPLDRENR